MYRYATSVIVKATNGPRYVVGCRRQLDKSKLKAGTRVALDMTTLTIMRFVLCSFVTVVMTVGTSFSCDIVHHRSGAGRLAAYRQTL